MPDAEKGDSRFGIVLDFLRRLLGKNRRKLPATPTLIAWRRYNAARKAEVVQQSLNPKTILIAPFHLGISRDAGEFETLVFDRMRLALHR